MQHSVRVGIVVFWTCVASGQSTDKVPSFEVADVQASKSTNPNPVKGGFSASGRVELPNMTIKQLMMGAYSVQENMITGGPKWLDSDRFDIVAKAAPNTPHATLFLMLQSLLAERFKLAIHREEKLMPAYALVRGKRALKLEPSTGGVPGQPDCKWQPSGPGRLQRICHNMTMADLARQLPGWGPTRVDLPVVDMSELKGPFDFIVEISTPGGRGERREGEQAATPDLAEITAFDAFEQIGLRLESRKMPMQVIVIDHVERVPTEN
jgi:uncharacterized protein (TIGR03435 family)